MDSLPIFLSLFLLRWQELEHNFFRLEYLLLSRTGLLGLEPSQQLAPSWERGGNILSCTEA